MPVVGGFGRGGDSLAGVMKTGSSVPNAGIEPTYRTSRASVPGGDGGDGDSVVGVMKMGNIMHRLGIEPISRAFRAIVITVTPARLPDATTLQTPTYLRSSFPEK